MCARVCMLVLSARDSIITVLFKLYRVYVYVRVCVYVNVYKQLVSVVLFCLHI